MSSLGDVILATSALETLSSGTSVDWIVAREFREVLEGHPRISRLWSFDRSLGFSGWIKLCRELWQENYEQVFDLHFNLRTRLMKVLFFYWGLRSGRRFSWKSISKERGRLFLFYVLKKRCPKAWRPTPWIIRFPSLLGGTKAQGHPSLKHLLVPDSDQRFGAFYSQQKYVCVMPGSQWKGKNWPVESYVTLLKTLPFFVVILGTLKDGESLQLVERLREEKISFFSGVGIWSLRETATVLARAVSYLGGDTGLAHLAEAMGISAQIIFGPTDPDMGFGPWRSESQAIASDLGCRPCGKDGRYCYRLDEKYLCLKGLSPDQVQKKITHLK